MNRTEAEKIVERDLYGLLIAMLGTIPAPAEKARETYVEMAPWCVECLMSGTMRLDSEGRLTAHLLGEARIGEAPRPQLN